MSCHYHCEVPGNDGRFPDDCAVQVPYPLPGMDKTPHGDWPWLDGTVLHQWEPDEWEIVVEDRRVAAEEDGTRARPDTPADKLWYPLCFRDSSEIRRTGTGTVKED